MGDLVRPRVFWKSRRSMRRLTLQGAAEVPDLTIRATFGKFSSVISRRLESNTGDDQSEG